jgi:predicted N-formylglutamate amidohydrolase
MESQFQSSLLSSKDPYPVEVINAESSALVLLLCEHAGCQVPERLGDLGLPNSTLRSHIGWDIGAESVAREISRQLSAPLVLQRYSRLVIDGNRPPHSTQSIPEISFGTIIPANQNLAPSEKSVRIKAIFDPMTQAIEEGFARCRRSAAFSIHSFTPQDANGNSRPWHAGFLSRKSLKTAQKLLDSVRQQDPDLALALNEPYQIEDETDWFIPVFAEAKELPHCLIEIRNDQISDAAGIEKWANLLVPAVNKVLSELT